MKMRMKLHSKIAYTAGYIAGIFGALFAMVVGSARLKVAADNYCARIEREVEREKTIREWKTKIDPAVRKAKDVFGFGHFCSRRSDTRQNCAEDVFQDLAEFAARLRNDHYAKTGEEVSAITVSGTFWSNNRALKVETLMTFSQMDGEGRVNVIHPAPERWRWKNLDRAMKCFLN